ncbi:murein biosynthesis integral membrane protein MurJ [Peribacillus frigoritolerans]
MNNSSISAIKIMVITLIGKMLGFMCDSILAYKFGASEETDAYLTAIMIPTVLFASLAAGINTSFIPIFSHIKEEKGLNAGFHFGNKILNFIGFFMLLLILILLPFTVQLTKVIAPGFSNDGINLTSTLLKYSLFMSIFVVLGAVYSAITQGIGKFGISNFKNVSQNIIIIISILILGSFWGIEGVTIGTVLAMVSHILVQIPALRKSNYKYRLNFKFRDKDIWEFCRLAFPIMLSTSFLAINLLIDRILVSGLGEGSVTALTFANKINQLVYGVFILSLITVVFPDFSKYANEKNWEKFLDLISNTIKYTIVITIPIVCVIIVLRIPIIKLLFENGSFTEKDTYITSIALFYYCLGTVSYGIQEIFNRGFYSLKDTKTPMFTAFFAVVCNIILSLIFVNILGIGGIALATSLSMTIRSLLTYKMLSKRIGSIFKSGFILFNFKMILSFVFCYITSELFKEVIVTGENKYSLLFQICLVSILGVFSYLTSLILLKVEEVHQGKVLIMKLVKKL